MKSFLKLLQNKKKVHMILAAVMTASVITFGGCSAGTAADNNSSAASVAQQTADNEANLSDARNTPVVRAAKLVGPTLLPLQENNL